MRTWIVAGWFAVALPVFAQSGDDAWRDALESRQQITDYLVRSARAITDQAVDEIRSVQVWEGVREKRRLELRESLGLLPWPERAPLKVRITGVLDKPGYRVEKIAFESLPKVYVTANLYVPKERKDRLPAIIYVCGHSGGPYGSKVDYQRHGISLAKNGYVVFVLDAIQLAETFALHHGVETYGMYDWYSRGYTPAGVEVWNAIRAIDYLETRPEVDRARIGMTGRSGGAAMSWFTAAVDPRIKVVAPVMGISTYAANVKLNTQRLHCDCMFPINACRHDMMHQGALIAPRPLLMAHGVDDKLFPVEGYKEFEEKVGALYQAYGKQGGFKNLEVPGGHKDSGFLREQAIRWFDKHLKSAKSPEMDLDYSEADGRELAVFDGKPPGDAVNFEIHRTFTARENNPEYKTLEAWEKRRIKLIDTLRKKVFAALPVESPHPAVTSEAAAEGSPARLRIVPEEGIGIRIDVQQAPGEGKALPTLLYVASEGETSREIDQFLRGVSPKNGGIRAVLYTRGVTEVPWDETFRKDTMRNAMHVGHTIDSMRLWDVLQAIRVLRSRPGIDPEKITVAGQGVSGAIGLYAAILEPAVHQLLLIDPPSSHEKGPVFLNVLRYTDLPEAAALIAPRRINFFSRMPEGYGRTKKIYELYGKPDHLFVALNVPALLRGRYDYNFSSGL